MKNMISKSEKKFQRVMHEFGQGELKSHGRTVDDQKQALAIAFSEARKVYPNYGMKMAGSDIKDVAVKGVFSLDAMEGKDLPGYTFGDTWNGFAVPYFERPQANLIMEGLGGTYKDGKYLFDDGYDGFNEYEKQTIQTVDGPKEVYAIGAYSWVWYDDLMKNGGGITANQAAELAKIYKTGTAKQLWGVWTPDNRIHFLMDHSTEYFELMGDDFYSSSKGFSALTYDILPSPIRKSVLIHHAQGMYRTGGSIASRFWNTTKKHSKSAYEKSKELAGKGYEKTKEGLRQAKVYTEKKIHDQKRDIALKVLDETRGKADTKADSRTLHIASNLVEENYAGGGGIKDRSQLLSEITDYYNGSDQSEAEKILVKKSKSALKYGNSLDIDQILIEWNIYLDSNLSDQEKIFKKEINSHISMAGGGGVEGNSLQKLRDVLDGIAIDLEGEDEEALASLRINLDEAETDAEVEKHISDFEKGMFNKIFDAPGKEQIKTAIANYRADSMESDVKIGQIINYKGGYRKVINIQKDAITLSEINNHELPDLVIHKEKIKKYLGTSMAEGAGVDEGVDLFEDYENIPDQVQKILDKYAEGIESGDYEELGKAKSELEEIGYTFEYYLDGQAYDLRKIGQKGKVEVWEEKEKEKEEAKETEEVRAARKIAMKHFAGLEEGEDVKYKDITFRKTGNELIHLSDDQMSDGGGAGIGHFIVSDKLIGNNYDPKNVYYVLDEKGLGMKSKVKKEAENILNASMKDIIQISKEDFNKEVEKYNRPVYRIYFEGGSMEGSVKIKEKINLSPSKKKLLDRINTLKATKANAGAAAQKAIQKKIDVLQKQFDYNPSAKERAMANKGKFALDVPAKYSKAIYKKLWSMKVFPKIHTLNGTSSIVVSSKINLDKAYTVFSDMMKEAGEKASPISSISRKL